MLAAALLLAAWVPAARAAEVDAPVTDAVHWEGLNGLDRERLGALSGLREGVTIDPKAVQRAIRALTDLPEVRQAAVRVEPLAPGRVAVWVSLTRAEHLARLSVEGADRLEAGKVARAARLVPGDEVDAAVLAAAAGAVRTLYEQAGFFGARVQVVSEPLPEDPSRDRVAVRITVDEGEQALIRVLGFAGHPSLNDAGLPTGVRLYSRPGRRFDADRLEQDMERAAAALEEQGYLSPRIGPFQLRPEGALVDVVVPVRVKDRVHVAVIGNRRLTTRKVLAVLDLTGQRTLDDRVLDEAARRLRATLVDRGYRGATVDITMAPAGDNLHAVRVNVAEGPLYRAARVVFEGNVALTRKELARLVSPGWRLDDEPVEERELIDRTATIQGVYRGIGYPDADVSHDVTYDGPSPQRATVTYRIDEGRRWWFESARVEGAEGLSPGIRAALDSAAARLAGQAFRRDRLRAERTRLGDLLGEYGHVDAEVSATIRTHPGWTGRVGPGGVPLMEERVDVVFHVSPGPEVRVGRVSLAGRFRTRPEVIQRELAFHPGDLFTPSTVAETRRRLFRAAAFDLVRITADPHEPDATVRDVTVQVDEGKPGAVELGIGYGEKDAVRTLVDLSYRDMFRRGHRAGIRFRWGQLRRMVSLNYALPWVGPYRANLSSRLLYEEEDLVSFDRVTRAGEVGIRPPVGRDLTLSVVYRLEFNRFPRLPEDQVSTLAGRRRINVGSIATSLVRDTRDDPFTPTRGTVVGATYEQGARALLSEVQFGKATAHLSGYHTLGRDKVLAANFQTGRVRKLFESAEVPVSERFFLGGQSTLRGYALDSVGVPGETLISGVPQGGEVMILANLELRVGGGEGWGTVLFVDAGNVWNLGRSIGLNDFRVGAGPGLHYATPVGPVRLDLGYKIDRRPGEAVYRLHFTLGHTF
ncbi:MAG: BamA/TamA family outer membrane protein [Nitrospirae bacterium]|nr:BamA/TamA family outer membrane protein [Nitrospirota bacterium]